ncbi:MAG: hypothetical protein EOP51_21675 [Sphingobacteriales bacterium]|nr:MAG: hypothetical protein EOP51_21675 [Sphingobacteriales bacterium]
MEPAIFGFNGLPGNTYDLDVYMAFVLETYYKKMIDITAIDGNTVLINYNEGIIAGMHKIASLTNICFDTSYQELAVQRAGFHAKQPQERFYEEQVPANMPSNLPVVMKLYEELDSRNIRWSDGG